MKFKQTGLMVAAMVAVFTLFSCSSTAPSTTQAAASLQQAGNPAELKASYAKLASAGGKVYTVDPKTSAVKIYVFRGGMATKLGHNHVLSAPQFDGLVYLPQSGENDARFDLVFRLDQLEIDNPAYRSGLGKAFNSLLPPGAIEGTREHMLGSDNLQADRFPLVRIHSVQMTGEYPKLAAKVLIEMHGQTREQWVPLSVSGMPDKLGVSGSFVMRQTDFGAQPYSVLGGLLAVKDEVVIEFNLNAV